MRNAEQFIELPARSRMAWSSRPVWDRRAPIRRGRRDSSDLGRPGRDGGRYRGDRRDRLRTRQLATSTALVETSAPGRVHDE